jgi:hypothetical protein
MWSGLVGAFAVVAIASALIGAILQYTADSIHHDRRHKR